LRDNTKVIATYTKMNYTLWDLICHLLEFDVNDEAAYDLRRAAPWKIITGMRETPYTLAELRRIRMEIEAMRFPSLWDTQ